MEKRDYRKEIFMNRLFVYGTLKQGQNRHYLLKDVEFEIAFLMGYEKQDPPSLGYPFIIRKEGKRVEGEVYLNISDSILQKIDIIEGEGDLYHRILVKVKTLKGEELNAFVYYPSQSLQDSFKSCY